MARRIKFSTVNHNDQIIISKTHMRRIKNLIFRVLRRTNLAYHTNATNWRPTKNLPLLDLTPSFFRDIRGLVPFIPLLKYPDMEGGNIKIS